MKFKTMIGAGIVAASILAASGPASADYITADDGDESTVAVGGVTGGTLAVFVEKGKTVDVTLAIVTESHSVDEGWNPTHSCNLHGEEWQLRATPKSSDSLIATVPGTAITFDDCTQERTVTITGVDVGEATISIDQALYEGTTSKSLDFKGTWRNTPTIDVTVTPVNDPTPRGYWKHAPAVANQLRLDCNAEWATNQTKKSPVGTNGHGMLTSFIAQEFGAWHGIDHDDPEYVDQVQDALEAEFESEQDWTDAMAGYAAALCDNKDAPSIF